jgi:hypothetical protein
MRRTQRQSGARERLARKRKLAERVEGTDGGFVRTKDGLYLLALCLRRIDPLDELLIDWELM